MKIWNNYKLERKEIKKDKQSRNYFRNKYLKNGAIIMISTIFIIISLIVGVNYIVQTSNLYPKSFTESIVNIAIGIIVGIVGGIIVILDPLLRMIILIVQNIIVGLITGILPLSIFSVSYSMWITILIVMFSISLVILLVSKTFMSISEGKTYLLLRILISFSMLIIIPVGVWLSYSILFVIIKSIFGISLFSNLDLYSMLKFFSLDLISESNTNFENISYILIFIICGIFIITILTKMSMALILRMWEIVYLSLFGLPIALAGKTSSSENDKLSIWTGLMVQKIVMPFFSIMFLFISLLLLREIIPYIMSIDFWPIGSDSTSEVNYNSITNSVLSLMVVIVTMNVSFTLIPEMAIILTKSGKAAFATQIKGLGGISSTLSTAFNPIKSSANWARKKTINTAKKGTSILDKTNVSFSASKESDGQNTITKKVLEIKLNNDVNKQSQNNADTTNSKINDLFKEKMKNVAKDAVKEWGNNWKGN